MFHHQQGIDKSSTDNLPSWTKFHLEEFDRIKYTAGVIMGHHLVVLVINEIAIKDEKGNQYDQYNMAYFLAFNLEDHSVQKVKIDFKGFKWRDEQFSFLKYGENQIIKYTPSSSYFRYFNMLCFTVESFEPFEVECEGVKDENEGKFSKCTAQIFKDCLYVFGKVKDKSNELWSFDLKNRTWKLYETTGEAPPVISDDFDDPYSFIYQDNLCIYRVLLQYRSPLPHLFMLDLNSMIWKKIEQQEKYLGGTESYLGGMGGTVYQDHFVTLRQDEDDRKNGNALCFLNLNTKNTWTVFDIKDSAWNSYQTKAKYNGLMAYKNLVLDLAAVEDNENLILALVDIDNFGICAPKSAEEEHLSSLFMSQNESDITFKVQDQLIPAHKRVLMNKSKYFAGLFNSNMAESKQDIIEIQDCEYEIFKEFLRWIYQGTKNLNDANQATKLYILADKYVQEDLREKCLNFLISILNMENIDTILDFAHQANITSLKSWCLKVCKDKLNILNVANLLKYLDRQEDSEFKENNKEFRNFALNFVLDNFFDIYWNDKGNIQFYEKFLMKNIEMETISSLAHFIGRDVFATSPKGKEIWKNSISSLKEAVFSFVERNAKVIMKRKISKGFPNDFLREFILYTTENLSNIQAENQALKNEKKRMEPSQNDLDGEGESHELKKTKQSDPKHGN